MGAVKAAAVTCPACHGRGEIIVNTATYSAYTPEMDREVECDYCGGAGSILPALAKPTVDHDQEALPF